MSDLFDTCGDEKAGGLWNERHHGCRFKMRLAFMVRWPRKSKDLDPSTIWRLSRVRSISSSSLSSLSPSSTISSELMLSVSCVVRAYAAAHLIVYLHHGRNSSTVFSGTCLSSNGARDRSTECMKNGLSLSYVRCGLKCFDMRYPHFDGYRATLAKWSETYDFRPRRNHSVVEARVRRSFDMMDGESDAS